MNRQKKSKTSDGSGSGDKEADKDSNATRSQSRSNLGNDPEEARRQKIWNEERRSSIWKEETAIKARVATTAITKPGSRQTDHNEGRRSMLTEKRQISERSLQRQSRRHSGRQPLPQIQRGESSRSVLTTEKVLIAQRSQRRLDVREARASASQSEIQGHGNPQMKQDEAKDIVPYFPKPGTADRVLPTLTENASTSSLEYSADSVAGPSHLPNNTFCWNVPSYPGNLVTAFVVDDDDNDSESKNESGDSATGGGADPEDVFKSEIPFAEEVCKATVDNEMSKWKRYTILISIVMLLALAVALTGTVVVLQRQSPPFQTNDSSALNSSTQHDNTVGSHNNTGIDIIKQSMAPTDIPTSSLPPNRIHATLPPSDPYEIIHPTEPPLVPGK